MKNLLCIKEKKKTSELDRAHEVRADRTIKRKDGAEKKLRKRLTSWGSSCGA